MAGKRVLIFAGGRIDPDVLQDIQADDVLIGASGRSIFGRAWNPAAPGGRGFRFRQSRGTGQY